MAPTIAERAANGEVLHAPDLTLEQRRELVVWARDQGMGYKEIKRKYGFHETESTLRGWKRNDAHGPMPREATFTPTDDALLEAAINTYATGPLDQGGSYDGIWNKVTAYVRQNGGLTSAGPSTMRERWNAISAYNVPPRTSSGGTRGKTGRGGAKPNTRTKTTAPTRSTQTSTSQNRPTSPVLPADHAAWGGYPSLSWSELVDVLGREGAVTWLRGQRAAETADEYEDLPDDELVELLGREEAEEFKRDKQAEGEGGDDVEEEDEGEEEGEGEEEEDEREEREEEDLNWNHEEYDSDVEGEDGADFS